VSKPPKVPTQSELEWLLKQPAHHPAEIEHFVKAYDGSDGIAQQAIGALTASEGALIVPGVTPATIKESVERGAKFRPLEEDLQPYYRRAYENRLEADSDTMRALLKINRMVQASGDRTLMDRFQFLADWIAKHHGHGGHPPPPAPPAK